jgi:D-glycero-D-manno-heptose 1,7-bisphosphate phosphatase
MLDLKMIDKEWTLFLDRDGVINYEKPGDYIYHWNEFIFYQGAREAIASFSERFGRIIIATNQRGIGKGLMTEKDLADMHREMIKEIEASGGRIDGIYYCSSLNDADPCRKPNPGMAFQAKKDFPQIDFTKSIMVGNTISDMHFGRNAGMYTVFLPTTHPGTEMPHPSIDQRHFNLLHLAKALEKS